jgi:hypothetical protein
MENYPLLNLFWTMLMFTMMFIWVWMAVSIFTDNFRRNDHSGWAKAMWAVFIVFLPILGILVYLIARPKMTEQDQEMLIALQEQRHRLQGYSSSDEIAKAQALLAAGTISTEEFANLKRRALA